jgi:hypothetical protein
MQDAATGEVYLIECNPRFWYSVFATYLAGLNFVKVGLTIKSIDPQKPLTVANITVGRIKTTVLKLLKFVRLNEADRRTYNYLIKDPVGLLCNIAPFFDDKRRRGSGAVKSQVAALHVMQSAAQK